MSQFRKVLVTQLCFVPLQALGRLKRWSLNQHMLQVAPSVENALHLMMILENLNSPSTNVGSVESSENEAENPRHINSNHVSEMYACASTSAHVRDVEDTNQAASEIGTAYEDKVNFSCDEFSSAFELSDDGSEVDEEHKGEADSEPENGAEESEHGALEDDVSDMYFTKLSEEYLPNQKTTRAQALLLILAYVVTSGLTWHNYKDFSLY
ncbi:hypothetical protein HPB49_002703 [Dermacentor silvarum]|uniref:Uncharacterized protein n=1 Tax=Dermacentor silvarum TaxID=543639 RepID=A0ACB8DAB5_DERSI|nr:hypothetical protein HPB49_002703 [Dermacentor silvarum]